MMDIFDTLEELRLLLENSGVERTVTLRRRMGNDCAYFRKSRELFMSKDYDRIVSCIDRVNQQISILKGPK